MSVRTEIETLRRELRELANQADTGLTTRFALWHPVGQRRTAYRRLRKALGRLLRRLHLRPTPPIEPWRPGLKHVDKNADAGAVVVWALGADAGAMRRACRNLGPLLANIPDRMPVLVTDVADFAYYSRLGWLIEYVPAFSKPAQLFGERKRRYLAWMYRDAPSLPLSIGLQEGLEKEDLLID